MTNNQLTREENVQAVFDLKAGYTLGLADVEILKRVARMALAAMDGEPVGYFGRFDPDDEDLIDQCSKNVKGAFPLYRHAQPALVPDKMIYQDGVLFVLNNDMSSIERGTVAMRAWNACRAAMLQELQKSAGASNNCRSNEKVQAVQVQPLPGINPAPALGSLPKRGEVLPTNSPVIPDRWIPVSERMPEAGGDMIVFTDGIVMSGVSYAKKKGFYIQALEYDDDEPVDSVTHWMPLPAAPQEVKSE